MPRILSGIQPTGEAHLGNYLGAIRQWVQNQDDDAFYCIVDLHALTVEIDPNELRQATLDTAIGLLAAGLDPTKCTLFIQSHVPEHTEMSWLLECVASYGELRRMTQFKEKGAGQDSVRASLLSYPVLMAADILSYDAELVPVGDDQRQHLELARNLAIRFNQRYGETFVVPNATIPKLGARVMDLQHPENKMSKSAASPAGVIALFDSADDIAKKVRRAVTDTDGELRYDPEKKPGLANLLELLASLTNTTPEKLATQYSSYAELKRDLGDAIIALLEPIALRAQALSGDRGAIEHALRIGAEKAKAVASVTLDRARDAIGLLAR